MDKNSFKTQLEAALAEPAAPETLVEQTISRAKAVSMGREAEERLAADKGALSAEEQLALLAQGMIGRYAMHDALPKNVSPAQAAEQLAADPVFRRTAGAQPADALERLQSGRLLQELAGAQKTMQQQEHGREYSKAEAEKQADLPRMEKQPPKNKRLPGMFR